MLSKQSAFSGNIHSLWLSGFVNLINSIIMSMRPRWQSGSLRGAFRESRWLWQSILLWEWWAGSGNKRGGRPVSNHPTIQVLKTSTIRFNCVMCAPSVEVGGVYLYFSPASPLATRQFPPFLFSSFASWYFYENHPFRSWFGSPVLEYPRLCWARQSL